MSWKDHAPAIQIVLLFLAAILSFSIIAATLPETKFVQESLNSVEESSSTVTKFSAATMSTSLAISALPDDFATPLADSLADMNLYFMVILVALFLEKILIQYGISIAFRILIPLACCAGLLSIATKKNFLKGLAIRIGVLGLAVAFVVPCSTHITDIVASDLTAYVNETIEETENGAGKLNEAMESSSEDKTIFEKLSDLFQTAVHGISDLMVHFQNTIRKCLNSIAILILTNCLMPLLTFLVLKWILRELFQIAAPLPSAGARCGAAPEPGSSSGPELVCTGGREL